MQGLLAWLHAVLLDWDNWKVAGIVGQCVFAARFIVQWLHSERVQRSVIPPLFWYLSLVGGAITLAYGIHRRELVIIVGQLPGLFVYLRNVQFIWRERQSPPPFGAKSRPRS